MLCKGQAEPCNALCTTASKEWKLSLPAVWLATRKTANPHVLQPVAPDLGRAAFVSGPSRRQGLSQKSKRLRVKNNSGFPAPSQVKLFHSDSRHSVFETRDA